MQRIQLSPNLAISESGFLFVPTTGESFTVSEVGRLIVSGLKSGQSEREIAQSIAGEFDVELPTAERDVRDFVQQLLAYKLAAAVDSNSKEN